MTNWVMECCYDLATPPNAGGRSMTEFFGNADSPQPTPAWPNQFKAGDTLVIQVTDVTSLEKSIPSIPPIPDPQYMVTVTGGVFDCPSGYLLTQSAPSIAFPDLASTLLALGPIPDWAALLNVGIGVVSIYVCDQNNALIVSDDPEIFVGPTT